MRSAARSTEAHEERYGFADPDADIELVTVRVAVALPGADVRPLRAARRAKRCSDRPSSSLDEATLVVRAGSAGTTGAWVLERDE